MKKRMSLCINDSTLTRVQKIKKKDNDYSYRLLLEAGLRFYETHGFKEKHILLADTPISAYFETADIEALRIIKKKENLSLAKTVENLIILGCQQVEKSYEHKKQL